MSNALTVPMNKLDTLFNGNQKNISELSNADMAVLGYLCNSQDIERVPITVGKTTVQIPKVIDTLFRSHFNYDMSGDQAASYLCSGLSQDLNDICIEDDDIADIISRAVIDEFEVRTYGTFKVWECLQD